MAAALPLGPAVLAPLVIGAALLATVAAESLGHARVPHLSPVERHELASPAPEPARPGDAAREGATINARPLFSTTRRPAETAGTTTAATAAPRLSAIFIGGADRRCVFDDGGHPLVVREGGHAGPYTVVAIGADRVTVADAGTQRVLRPTLLPPGDGTTASAGAAPIPFGPRPGVFEPQPPPVTPLSSLVARLRNLRGGSP